MDAFNWLREALQSANKHLHEQAIFRFKVQSNELTTLREERKAFDAKIDALKTQLKQTEVARDSWMLTAKAFAKENDGLKRDIEAERSVFASCTSPPNEVLWLHVPLKLPTQKQAMDYFESIGLDSMRDTMKTHYSSHELSRRIEQVDKSDPLTIYRGIINTIAL
jgi:hypothetical protein